MRRVPLLLTLALAACHKQPAPPAANRTQPQPTQPQTQTQTAPAAEPGEAKQEAAGAAEVLRHYYALIEAGRYDDAWAMRTSGRGSDAAQFAAHFKAYQR